MKSSSELINLPVISISDGAEVGKVMELIFNPQKTEIMGIMIQDKKWWKEPKVVAFALICGIGENAITIENLSALSDISTMPEVEELLERNIRPKGTSVITRSGKKIGKISEYFIDTKVGKVLSYEIELEDDKKLTVNQDKVVTIGKDVLVVKNEVLKEISEIIEKVKPEEIEEKLISEEVPPTIEVEEEPEKIVEEEVKLPEVEVKEVKEVMALPEEKIEEKVEEKIEVAPPKPSMDIKDIFLQRQKKFLLSKKVSRSIIAPDGTVIINEGDIITEEVIEKAKAYGKFVELSVSVKT